MSKRSLLLSPPLSKILRRAFSSDSSPLFLLHSAPESHPFSSFSPSYRFLESSSFRSTARCSFLGIPNPPGKSFCSDSAEKVTGGCWNCHAAAGAAPFLVCGSCQSVQPVVHSVDYFQIFGLEKKFDIKDDNLEGKYKDWQKKLHPDLVHTKSKKEKEYAAEQSARVIDAYRTLRNPLLRAIYILRLEGVHVDEERTISDPSMLAEIMEIREAVEEANDPRTLNLIQSQIREKLMHWSQSFLNAFQNREFEEAQTSIQRMTYYDRVNEEIIKKL